MKAKQKTAVPLMLGSKDLEHGRFRKKQEHEIELGKIGRGKTKTI